MVERAFGIAASKVLKPRGAAGKTRFPEAPQLAFCRGSGRKTKVLRKSVEAGQDLEPGFLKLPHVAMQLRQRWAGRMEMF